MLDVEDIANPSRRRPRAPAAQEERDYPFDDWSVVVLTAAGFDSKAIKLRHVFASQEVGIK